MLALTVAVWARTCLEKSPSLVVTALDTCETKAELIFRSNVLAPALVICGATGVEFLVDVILQFGLGV